MLVHSHALSSVPCAGYGLHKSYHGASMFTARCRKTHTPKGQFQISVEDICQLRRLIAHGLFLNKDCQASLKLQTDNCRPADSKG